MDNNKTEEIGHTHIIITFPHALAKGLCSITELTFRTFWVHNLLFPLNLLIFIENVHFWVIFNLHTVPTSKRTNQKKQTIDYALFCCHKNIPVSPACKSFAPLQYSVEEMKENWIGWRNMLCRLESNKAYKNTNICSVIAISDSEFNSTDSKFKVHKITQNKCTTDVK